MNWNGNAWSVQHYRSLPKDADIGGLTCTSASKCFAVGSTSAKTLIERFA